MNIENVSPIPPPFQLQDTIEKPAIGPKPILSQTCASQIKELSNAERRLTRISERSSSEEGHQPIAVSTDTLTVVEIKDIAAARNIAKELAMKEASPAKSARSRSGSEASNERPEDTMSEQNYTTSEDNEVNPPSLCSDLPENVALVTTHGAAYMQSNNHTKVTQSEGSRESSKDFPSPPSSMLEGTTTTATQEGRTEVTQIEPDSLFLEMTPPDLDAEMCDTNGGSIPSGHHDEGNVAHLSQESNKDQSSDKNVKNTKLEKIPYDISISSENDVTNNQETQDPNSEGSLHDSMEILEEIATEDHFERDLDSEEEPEVEDDDRDIFEMPPMASVAPPLIQSELEHLSHTFNLQLPPQTPPSTSRIPVIEEDLAEDITTSTEPTAVEQLIQPYTQDPNIRQLRLHLHSPNCRPPKKNGSGDEFIF